MVNPFFLDRVAREATDCAKAARELADRLNSHGDEAGERLAEAVTETLIKLAYDALGETQPINPPPRKK